MTKEELKKEIAKKIKELKDMYYKAYPNGNYLTIGIFKDSMQFNNQFWDDDIEFPIDYWEGEDCEDDNERI